MPFVDIPPVENPPDRPNRKTLLLTLGIARTGSGSLARALSILGYQDVHHATTCAQSDFVHLDRYCDAVFPCLPTYTGEKLTREDWDACFGPCEVVTDMAPYFWRQMLEVWPDVRVVLVEREYARWWRSVDETLLRPLFILPKTTEFIEGLLGKKMLAAGRKLILGFFNARDVHEIRRNARETFDKYHADVKAAVPADRMLVMKLGDGWGPLCEFLGKPVPEVPFPRVNESEELRRKIYAAGPVYLGIILRKVAPWIVAMVAISLAFQVVT